MATPSLVFFTESFTRDTRPCTSFQKLSTFGNTPDAPTRESAKAKQRATTASLKTEDVSKGWIDFNAIDAPVILGDGLTGNKG